MSTSANTDPASANLGATAPAGLLAGKVAIVTGAARGMGEETARLFAEEGATVCLWDIRPGVGDVAASLPNGAAAFQLDTTERGAIDEAVQTILEKHGRIDILINCAGIARQAMFLDMDDALRDSVFGVNFIGTYNCCKAVLPAMVARKSGRLVNISSVTGPLTVLSGASAYGASKAAISALTKSLAVEMGPHGITVNAILPGAIETPMLTDFFAEQGWDADEVIAEMAKNVPLGRVGKPRDIAGACLMLVSDYTCYVTGVELIVDGALNLPERG